MDDSRQVIRPEAYQCNGAMLCLLPDIGGEVAECAPGAGGVWIHGVVRSVKRGFAVVGHFYLVLDEIP